jgi:acetylornithine deacetylase
MDPNRIAKAKIEDLVRDLVAENSVSSLSNVRISRKVAEWLEILDFTIEWIEYKDQNGVAKASIVAKREARNKRNNSPGTNQGAAYLAHTDVVPVDDWNTGFSGPFEAVQKDGKLYGRGTCDMKGSLCCAIQAAALIDPAEQSKPLYFVITADEEIGMEGAQQVDQRSLCWQEMIDQDVTGIIGEPTQMQVVHGHKGTFGVILRAEGQSAHTSTGKGISANDALIPALGGILELKKLTETSAQYRNDQYEPPTVTMNVVIKNEPLAINITTALAEAHLFFRTMPQVDSQSIVHLLKQIQKQHNLKWIEKGEKAPWSVESKSPWVQDLLALTQNLNSKTVSYGTDASVLQRLSKLVVCGPGSIEQAHRKDEWISIEQLHQAVKVYEQAFRKWAC